MQLKYIEQFDNRERTVLVSTVYWILIFELLSSCCLWSVCLLNTGESERPEFDSAAVQSAGELTSVTRSYTIWKSNYSGQTSVCLRQTRTYGAGTQHDSLVIALSKP